jgi:two-component system cell cycle sensor histidine kinase/response regulator CckA
VRFGSRPARLVLANDVTERRRLEQQLRHSQKMEALGRLAAGMAHDFNNLLSVIMGYSELVSRHLPADDSLLKNVNEILKAADRSAALTQQLLAFSRKQVLQPRVLDLNTIVGETEKMLRRLIGEDIELKTRLQENLGTTVADPGQIEQVIINLAVNARDAMENGGSLILETHDVNLDESYVHLHPGARCGRHVMLAVSDTGLGMDAETLARIYEPFFTTKPEGKGTGLGLSTVYGIVEQSGGHIEVYSEKARGTTFKIFLPYVGESSAGAERYLPDAGRATGTETVLVVEDDAALRILVRETLEQAGYKVLEGTTPHHALSLAASHPGNIHLVLTDVVMPGMSGRDLREKLKDVRPGSPVAFMSGYTDETIGQLGLLEPGVHFLRKPFTSDRLLGKVREALRGPAVQPEGVTCAS